MFKKEEEGETRELSPDPWEDHRANAPFKREGVWKQPVWICWGKCCLSNLTAFYHEVSVQWMRWEQWAHLNTASSMISRGFCVLRLGGWTTRRVTNWLDCWASEGMANSCCLDTSDTLGFSRSSSNVHCLCFWMMGPSQILQAHHWHSAGEQGRETQNVEVLRTCLTKNLSNLIKLWR